MSGTWSLNVEIDRSTGTFNVLIDYHIDAYIDPETSEYFGDTSWMVDYSLAGGGSVGGGSGFGAESALAYLSLGLLSGDFVLSFSALNTFSADSIATTWNVFNVFDATTPQTVVGSASDDLIIGGDSDDMLRGLDGADLVDAGAGDDIVDGGAGDDRLDGLDGDDILIGGAGDDTFMVDTTGDIVIERAGQGYDRVIALASTILADNVEELTLYGVGPMNGTGNAGNNRIFGSEGANILTGGDGDDILSGNGGDDVLRGGQGADELAGRANGTALGDTATYSDSSVGIVASLATGLGSGGAAQGDRYIEVENLEGSQGNDDLTGSAGGNILRGLGGNDVLRGGAGADTLEGGTGADIASYYTSAVGVTVNLATGASSGGTAQGDVLTGIEGLSGSQGNDRLTGDAGANTLQGWNGGDVLTGGTGKDTLTGGAGADRFAYGGTAESTVGANADRITDFTRAQNDRIDLSAIDASTALAGNQVFTFIGTGVYTGVAGQLRYAVAGGVTTIAGDVNGDKVSDFQIQLTGSIALLATDFIL
ncbi:calcium-binding protein [Inquilinus sp.]|jgi:Ca2+-binding RTX toxin-like protein|uniref:calcium-binding protein n=1 Tax=Inquilinus sp. TaxID=1932117 RepID=UPI0037846CE5